MSVVVIGGSASTGSSLLMRMLDRHNEIAAGPETSIFARPALIEGWETHKHLLIGKHIKKLRNEGWHRYYGVDLTHDFYGLSKEKLKIVVSRSADFVTFVDALQNHVCNRYNKVLWVEKTPSNAYSFQFLARQTEQIRFVLMVRNPYDAIASMFRRGFSLTYAVAYYLMNTAFGLEVDPERMTVIKYEDLVQIPEEVLGGLCRSWDHTFDSRMLQPSNEGHGMEGWQYDETGEMGTDGLGRFDSLRSDIQDSLVDCCSAIRIKKAFNIRGCGATWCTIEELCRRLGYEPRIGNPQSAFRKTMVGDIFKEKVVRTIMGYPTHAFNFPIEFIG